MDIREYKKIKTLALCPDLVGKGVSWLCDLLVAGLLYIALSI